MYILTVICNDDLMGTCVICTKYDFATQSSCGIELDKNTLLFEILKKISEHDLCCYTLMNTFQLTL